MASYVELRNLFGSSAMLNRVATAVIIAANGILGEVGANAARNAWANKAFSSAEQEAKRVWMAVLAANSEASVDQIQGVSDVALQNDVDAAISLFIDVDSGV